MSDVTREELLNIFEKIAEGQLRAVRTLRRDGRPRGPHKRQGTSNISIVEDILKAKAGPLHINEIIQIAAKRYGKKLSRESLVSALTKKVLDEQTFCRVARNTFDLRQRKELTQ
jgi:hypothetical protein